MNLFCRPSYKNVYVVLIISLIVCSTLLKSSFADDADESKPKTRKPRAKSVTKQPKVDETAAQPDVIAACQRTPAKCRRKPAKKGEAANETSETTVNNGTVKDNATASDNKTVNDKATATDNNTVNDNATATDNKTVSDNATANDNKTVNGNETATDNKIVNETTTVTDTETVIQKSILESTPDFGDPLEALPEWDFRSTTEEEEEVTAAADSWYMYNKRRRVVITSLQDAIDTLARSWFSVYPGLLELVGVFEKRCIEPYTIDNSTISHRLYPFITIEGVTGSGNTFIARGVSEKLGGTFMKSPPPCLFSMRPFFDRHKMTIRRVYYTLCYYAISHQAKYFQSRMPVVTDKYYSSNAAQVIAMEFQKKTMLIPPPEDPVYKLPKDLNRPTMSFYINVTQQTRQERLVTYDRFSEVADTFLTIIPRMRCPVMIPVSGNEFHQMTTDNIIKILQRNSVISVDTAFTYSLG